MAVMEQKVNFFTILPNHKLGQFLLKELTKYLGIFGYTYFILLLWWIMKVSNQICKSENDLSRMNYESKTGWKSGQWYFLTKIVLTYCEKNCSSDREKLNAENLQKFCDHYRE